MSVSLRQGGGNLKEEGGGGEACNGGGGVVCSPERETVINFNPGPCCLQALIRAERAGRCVRR